ncbi:MAG: asparagine--tRNA ligase [Bacteroidetes bacterium]|jgi:asparaginyl-tRNA synthetase|nr:asparagine--tRNA ligase [Bacteroidota bacterium]
MSARIEVKQVLADMPIGESVTVSGWVKTFRNNQFIALSDGSCISTLQLVVDREEIAESEIRKINPGAAIRVTGELTESLGRGQKVEVKVKELHIYGESDPEVYPLQPKKHSLEFLREKAHLRMRTNTFGAIFRIRHHIAYAIHQFFHEQGYFYMHTPVITASDAEGAGEMFQITNLSLNDVPKNDQGEVDYSKDFFKQKTHLTVSGQLEAEVGAMALSKVYTFGPTFRAENSNTSRHLAEFWMIEPEIAFADIHDNMDVAEKMLKYILGYVLDSCDKDLQFLEDRIIKEDKQKPKQERQSMALREKLRFCSENEFERLTYSEAIEILLRSKPNKKRKFNFVIEGWGADLQSEHERYLVEKHFKKPVILRDYPKDIKAFYMRQNDDDKTVAAMDILFPGIGEIVGGAQREERLSVLKNRMQEMDVPEEHLWWYLELRKFGTAPHAGFGLGFERLVQFVTGMTNIRDVIGFPRYPGHVEF